MSGSSPIFKRIQILYADLPQKMRRIADFIIQQQEQAAFLTGKEIALSCQTSPATVARFFKILGYEKFQSFALEAQNRLKERRLPLRKIQEAFNFQAEEEEMDSLEQTCLYERRNIEALLAVNNRDCFADALKCMFSASSICLVGDRSAYALVHYAGSVLRSFSNRVDFFASGEGMAYERMEALTENDLLIGVSFHRYAQSTWKLMRYAWKKGVPVLAITDSASSPLSDVSTYRLLAPNEAPFYSYTTAMILFNALIRSYAYHKKDLAPDFKKRASMLLSNDVYLEASDMR